MVEVLLIYGLLTRLPSILLEYIALSPIMLSLHQCTFSPLNYWWLNGLLSLFLQSGSCTFLLNLRTSLYLLHLLVKTSEIRRVQINCAIAIYWLMLTIVSYHAIHYADQVSRFVDRNVWTVSAWIKRRPGWSLIFSWWGVQQTKSLLSVVNVSTLGIGWC